MSVAIKPLQTQRDSMIDTDSLSTSFMNTTIPAERQCLEAEEASLKPNRSHTQQCLLLDDETCSHQLALEHTDHDPVVGGGDVL